MRRCTPTRGQYLPKEVPTYLRSPVEGLQGARHEPSAFKMSVQPSQAHSTHDKPLDLPCQEVLRLNCELQVFGLRQIDTLPRLHSRKQNQLQHILDSDCGQGGGGKDSYETGNEDESDKDSSSSHQPADLEIASPSLSS